MKKILSWKRNRGMSYVELIVVLTIFSVLSGVVIYNYSQFQAKVDVKNLASDIALRISEAQKSAVSGALPVATFSSTWKPSYGVSFDSTDNKSFIYFTDLDQNGYVYNPTCSPNSECLEKVSITKNDSISSLKVFYQGDTVGTNLNDLSITFVRPNAGAIIKSTTPFTGTISYVQITVASPRTFTAIIKVYASGRIQVN